MTFDPQQVFPSPVEIIKAVTFGPGGEVGGASLMILSVIIIGSILRPIFILSGMRFDRRAKPAQDWNPYLLVVAGAAVLIAGPTLLNKPHLLDRILFASVEIPTRLPGEADRPRHETGARVCNPDTGCNTLSPAAPQDIATLIPASALTEVATFTPAAPSHDIATFIPAPQSTPAPPPQSPKRVSVASLPEKAAGQCSE